MRRNKLLKIFLVSFGIFSLLIFCIFMRLNENDKLDTHSLDSHKLDIIIPHKNRIQQLTTIVVKLSKHLQKQNIKFKIYIVNQIDNFRFNRGALINIGFNESATGDSDYIAIHDIDLIPNSPKVDYHYPLNSPLHLIPPRIHPLYKYKKYFGGIVLIYRKQFSMVNGMSNIFWGWGREDDEFRLRILRQGYRVSIPKDLSDGEASFLHIHNDNEIRDSKLTHNQANLTFHADFKTGLNTLSYTLVSKHEMIIDNSQAFTFLNVKLNCDLNITPYCIKT